MWGGDPHTAGVYSTARGPEEPEAECPNLQEEAHLLLGIRKSSRRTTGLHQAKSEGTADPRNALGPLALASGPGALSLCEQTLQGP